MAVAVEAIQAIGNLARGLRSHFSGSSRSLLPVLLVTTTAFVKGIFFYIRTRKVSRFYLYLSKKFLGLILCSVKGHI